MRKFLVFTVILFLAGCQQQETSSFFTQEAVLPSQNQGVTSSIETQQFTTQASIANVEYYDLFADPTLVKNKKLVVDTIAPLIFDAQQLRNEYVSDAPIGYQQQSQQLTDAEVYQKFYNDLLFNISQNTSSGMGFSVGGSQINFSQNTLAKINSLNLPGTKISILGTSINYNLYLAGINDVVEELSPFFKISASQLMELFKQQNPSGFLQNKLTKPNLFINKIEGLSINILLPQATIDKINSLHLPGIDVENNWQISVQPPAADSLQVAEALSPYLNPNHRMSASNFESLFTPHPNHIAYLKDKIDEQTAANVQNLIDTDGNFAGLSLKAERN